MSTALWDSLWLTTITVGLVVILLA